MPINSKLLTKRWFPLPSKVLEHSEINRLKASTAQFRVIAAGRRSFKTETMKRRFVRTAAFSDKPLLMFLGAPTRPQAKLIFWEDLKALSPSWSLNRKPLENELCINYNNGSKLFVLGLQEKQRVEGSLWHMVGVTEYQECDAKLFSQSLQPILNDTGGEGWFEGRPIGRNHFYDDMLRAQKDITGRWDFFTWKSSDILSEQQIADALHDLDRRTYEREYDASFGVMDGLAYYAFGKENYTTIRFRPEADTWLCWDFNASEKPMSCIVLQKQPDNTFAAVKEFVHNYSNTEQICQLVEIFFKEQNFNGKLEVTGDHAGRRRESSASFTDYEIITSHFKHHKGFVVKTRPTILVNDRVASLNAQFQNAARQRRMFVNVQQCPALVKDLELVEWQSNGVHLNDKHVDRTHPTDALSYFAYNYFPTDRRELSVKL